MLRTCSFLLHAHEDAWAHLILTKFSEGEAREGFEGNGVRIHMLVSQTSLWAKSLGARWNKGALNILIKHLRH